MLKIVFTAFIAVAALLAPLFYAGPQLASDWSVGQQWTFAEDLAVKESNCTRWYFVVSTCNITYVNRRDPGKVGGSLNYLVLGSWAGERVLLLRAAKDSNKVSTTLGVEHMRLRIVSFCIFAAVAFAAILGLIAVFFGAILSDGRSGQAEPSEPLTPTRQPNAQTFGRRAAGI